MVLFVLCFGVDFLCCLNLMYVFIVKVAGWSAAHSACGVFFMPPTLKKLEGHIAFGLSVCLSVCVCVR